MDFNVGAGRGPDLGPDTSLDHRPDGQSLGEGGRSPQGRSHPASPSVLLLGPPYGLRQTTGRHAASSPGRQVQRLGWRAGPSLPHPQGGERPPPLAGQAIIQGPELVRHGPVVHTGSRRSAAEPRSPGRDPSSLARVRGVHTRVKAPPGRMRAELPSEGAQACSPQGTPPGHRNAWCPPRARCEPVGAAVCSPHPGPCLESRA